MENAGDALFVNYLEFLRTHRGSVKDSPSGVAVTSSRPEFSFLTLAPPPSDMDLVSSFNTVMLAPWSTPTAPELGRRGFRRTGGLTFMTLDPRASASWPISEDVAIERVTSPEAMADFSEIQARGFLESEAAYAEWHPWLHAANSRQIFNEGQRFYIGKIAGVYAGVALGITTHKLLGLYAIATVPTFRKRGVSTTLMHHAIAKARSNGCSLITLQVAQGSYAEAFYQRLGFATAFTLEKYQR